MRKWKRPINHLTGQPASYFRFEMGSGWYLSVSPDAGVREMEEILHILRLAMLTETVFDLSNMDALLTGVTCLCVLFGNQKTLPYSCFIDQL